VSIAGREQPRIALLYTVPLLCEALSSAFENIAEVQSFPAGRADVVGLLRSLRPDAVVVDDAAEADEAQRWTSPEGLPLVHISLRERKLRLLRDGAWEESDGTSAEAIRNLLAGSIYARGG
jgi:hypothetical protein